MPGVRCTRSLVCSVESTRVVTTGSPGSAGIPCTMVLTVSFVLPGDRALLPPSPAEDSADLTPASGRQDHTTSPSADGSIRLMRHRIHHIPHLTSVTIAIRPSCRDGMAAVVVVIWVCREAEYFSRDDWTGQISLMRHANFHSRRKAIAGRNAQAGTPGSGQLVRRAGTPTAVHLMFLAP